jgi:hypothetical protein
VHTALCRAFSTASFGFVVPVALALFGSGHRFDTELVPPSSRLMRWSYSVVLTAVWPYSRRLSALTLSVFEAGGRTVAV